MLTCTIAYVALTMSTFIYSLLNSELLEWCLTHSRHHYEMSEWFLWSSCVLIRTHVSLLTGLPLRAHSGHAVRMAEGLTSNDYSFVFLVALQFATILFHYTFVFIFQSCWRMLGISEVFVLSVWLIPGVGIWLFYSFWISSSSGIGQRTLLTMVSPTASTSV